MCMHIYVCVYTYMNVYVYVYVHTYICVYTYTCTRKHAHTHIHTHTHTYTHTHTRTCSQVSRTNLWSSSLEALEKISNRHLLKRLHVTFDGEDGSDFGGVRREWYHLITLEMVCMYRMCSLTIECVLLL